MAFIKNLKRTCAVCGNVHNFQKIVETEGIGMRDLDTRLPGLSRNMIHLFMEKCPKCGYVNNDISILLDNFDESELKNENYQKVLNDESINFALKKFVLHALLQQKRDNKKTGMAYLKAAWMADDAKKTKESRLLRSKAIKYLELSLNDEDDNKDNINLIIVDLYRRIGMFDEASDYAKYLLNNFGLEKYKQNILLYQIKLCQDEDVLDHTIPGNYNFLVERVDDEQ